jgi:hypothetical protein
MHDTQSSLRVRWAAIGAAVAVTLGAGGIGIARATVSTGARPVFVSITPCRLVDTRPAPSTVGTRSTPLNPNETATFTVHGTNGNCTIPVGAVAIDANVTITAPTSDGFLTVFPADALLPNASNLNWSAGQAPTPNAVTVDLSTDGKVKVFNERGTVNVIIDIVGYYEDHDHDDRYVRLGPVTLGQGVDWVTNGGNPTTVDVFENGTQIDDLANPGGTAQLSLIGPILLGATNYRLASVTYCVLAAGTGMVDEASIIGLAPDGAASETKDTTDRPTDGCFTITPSTVVAAASAHHLMLFVRDIVFITQVTATWTPV